MTNPTPASHYGIDEAFEARVREEEFNYKYALYLQENTRQIIYKLRIIETPISAIAKYLKLSEREVKAVISTPRPSQRSHKVTDALMSNHGEN